MSDAAVGPAVEVVDGRRARRERNRIAVIDAMFALLAEGHFPPSVEDVAERAQVSVSSVFRYFESLDDLQRVTIERYFERFDHLFAVTVPDDERLDARVDALVDSRLDLYEAIAPIARMARVRAVEQSRLADTLAETRRFMTEQLRRHFEPELRDREPTEASDRLAAVDALTAFEAWDLLHGTHGRRRHEIRRAWVNGLLALLS